MGARDYLEFGEGEGYLLIDWSLGENNHHRNKVPRNGSGIESSTLVLPRTASPCSIVSNTIGVEYELLVLSSPYSSTVMVWNGRRIEISLDHRCFSFSFSSFFFATTVLTISIIM